jgi:OmpA-OmpF porin, OOP family
LHLIIIRLSLDRADAVMTALVRTHGINDTRLKAFGNGPFAPVASNDTEDGKAKNRRVELAKQ